MNSRQPASAHSLSISLYKRARTCPEVTLCSWLRLRNNWPLFPVKTAKTMRYYVRNKRKGCWPVIQYYPRWRGVQSGGGKAVERGAPMAGARWLCGGAGGGSVHGVWTRPLSSAAAFFMSIARTHAAAARAAMAAALNSRCAPPAAKSAKLPRQIDLELPRVDNPVPKCDAS